MKNSGASSSYPKGKRPMSEADLEILEKVAKEDDRVKRINHEAKLKGISYDDCKIIVGLEETELVEMVEKQNTEDELLAKALAQQLEDDETELVKRQIQDDELLVKVLAQEEQKLPIRDDSILPLPSNLQQEKKEEDDEDFSIPPLTRKKRNISGGSHI